MTSVFAPAAHPKTLVFAQAAHPKLILVRHGAADGEDGADPGLSALGRQQAEALGARLRGHGIERVLHSPRRRAAETAAVIAPLLEVSPAEMGLLDDLTPVPSTSCRADYPTRYLPWLDATAPDERDEDGYQLTSSLRELAVLAEVNSIVAVTHAFVIAWFVRAVLDAPTWRWIGLQPANCSLTTIAVDGDALTLQGFNDVGHLERG